MWGHPEEEREQGESEFKTSGIKCHESGGKTAASTAMVQRLAAPPPCTWYAGEDYAVITEV